MGQVNMTEKNVPIVTSVGDEQGRHGNITTLACAEILRKVSLTSKKNTKIKPASEITVKGPEKGNNEEAPFCLHPTLSYICNVLCSAVKPITSD